MSPELDKAMLLPPIEGLSFDPKAHRYSFNGKWLRNSPTGVLSHDMDEHARKRIEETRPDWEPRGNLLHLWLEHFLTGAAEVDPGDYKDWVDPLRDCWLWKNCTVLASELRLVDPKRNMGGSVDFLIKTGKTGAVCIGDLKTVSSIDAMNRRKPADAQLGAYTRMFNLNYPHIYIERAVTVVAAPGQTRVITSNVDSCSHAWEEAWGKYQAAQDLIGF